MSWWTSFRDGLESAAGLVANYFYPGTIALGHYVNSKGSQQQLFGTGWGQAAGALTSLAGLTYGGAYGGGGGTAATNSAAGDMTTLGSQSGYGFSGTSTLGGNPEALKLYQNLVESGYNPGEAAGIAGVTPQQVNGAASLSGAAPTWEVGTTNGFGDVGTSALNPNGGGGGGSNAGGGKPAMPWGSAGNLYTMGTGALGLLGAGVLNNAGQLAQEQADPFGPYRKQYADKMAALAADPSSITQQPGYEAGMQAIKRSMASQGYTGSGNMMAAMSKYGGDQYDKLMSMYSGLAGAQFNPAQGAALGLQGTTGALSLAGQSLNRMGYGVGMAGTFGSPQRRNDNNPNGYGY